MSETSLGGLVLIVARVGMRSVFMQVFLLYSHDGSTTEWFLPPDQLLSDAQIPRDGPVAMDQAHHFND